MRWLTTAEVAEAIQETSGNVSRRCARGDIRATKLGGSWRITEQDLVAFMSVNNDDRTDRVQSTVAKRTA